VAFIVALSPSGDVPGDGADGHSVELVFIFGGEGLDGFFQSLFQVLFVKVVGRSVFSFFFEVLVVICLPTD
jgi:hypothetical protein